MDGHQDIISADEHIAITERPSLYRCSAVLIASLIGGPLAGAWIIAHNLQSMGQAHRVSSVWWVAIGLITLGLGLAWLAPEAVPGAAFAVAIAFCMHELSKFYMQEYLRVHAEQGGNFVRNWWVIPVGICGILLQLAVVGAFVLLDV